MNNIPNPSTNRRQFIRQSAALAAFTIVPRHVLGNGPTPPSEKLNIACVGVGGKGFSDAESVASQNIVAICDVDDQCAARAFSRFPDAKRYRDWRTMLDKEPLIDAVMVATPDHCHALISLAALKRGKHVYCQKPLTHTVEEAQLLAAAAAETKLATQMGNQGHASKRQREFRRLLPMELSDRYAKSTSGRIGR
jgi:predicted dehydrogenase